MNRARKLHAPPGRAIAAIAGCVIPLIGFATPAFSADAHESPAPVAEDRCAGSFDLVVSKPERDVFWEGCLAYPDKYPPAAGSESRICVRIRNAGCEHTPLFTNAYDITYDGKTYPSYAIPFERIDANDFTVICTAEPVRVRPGTRSVDVALDILDGVVGEADEANRYRATLTAGVCPSLRPPCTSSATYDSTAPLAALGGRATLSRLGATETASLQVLSDSYLCDWHGLADGSLTANDFTPAAYRDLRGASDYTDPTISGPRQFDGKFIKDGDFLGGSLKIRTIDGKTYAAFTDYKAEIVSGSKDTLTLIDFSKIFIDNVHLYAAPSDSGRFGLYIRNADELIVRNSTFTGRPGRRASLYVTGVGRVVADRLAFSGIDGKISKAIFVNNGDQKVLGDPSCGHGKGVPDNEGFCYRLDRGLPELRSLVIQNSRFDNNADDGVAVHIHTPSNGLLFNTVARNWLKNTYYVWDIGFRTHSFSCDEDACSCADGNCNVGDKIYKENNVVFRIERNITWESGSSKDTGRYSGQDNKLIFANNIFYESGTLAEAHTDWPQWKAGRVKSPDIYRLNNTFIPGSEYYLGLWGAYFVIDPQSLHHENNLILIKRESPLKFMIHVNGAGDTDTGGYARIYKDKALAADYNLYVADKSFEWIQRVAGPDEPSFERWRQGPPHAEAHGRCYGPSCGPTTFATADVVENVSPTWGERMTAFIPRAGSPALDVWNPKWATYSADKRLRVDRDFNGYRRGTRPGENAAGAFVRPVAKTPPAAATDPATGHPVGDENPRP
jgi:hypothetical protein